MVLRIYGHPKSTSVQRVLVVLKEKQVQYELVPVDFFGGEHTQAPFLKKNPFGQIPYIDDDGFILYESLAISKYIAAKYARQGTPLLPDPSDLRATALFEAACSIEENNFLPFASGIVVEKYGKRFRGIEPDEERIKEFMSALDQKLDGYETILGKQRFLAGNEITVADLAHLSFGAVVSNVGVKLLEDTEKRPNVARWWKEISSRPAWLSVLAEAEADA